jgi:signal peptidase II
MTRMSANRYIVFLLIAVSGAGWDLYTKHRVFRDLGYPGGESDWVKEFFDGWLTYRHYTSFNKGALWGLGQEFTWLFASLSVVAALGILYWLFVHGAARSLWLTTALALIMGGTLGNLYDRLGLHGCLDETGQLLRAVRDFHLFTFGNWSWPIFNYADSFLVTGAIMLVLQSFQPDEQPAAAAGEAETEAEATPQP